VEEPIIPSTYDDDPAFYTQRAHFRIDSSFLVLALTLIALALMGWGYFRTLRPVTLQIDQETRVILTNQTIVDGVLNDAALSLFPEDIVFPALDAPIPANQPIAIRRARPLEIQVDGETRLHRTQSQTVIDALRQAGITLRLNDRVLIGERAIDPNMIMTQSSQEVLPLTVQRAVPLHVDDNGARTTLYTTAPTFGEALRQAGLVVYLGDFVTPDLGAPTLAGGQVNIQRSRAATIIADGKTIRTRTLGNNVAELLLQEGIELKDKDYSIPAATDPVRDGISVRVMRVREEFMTESEYIPYETVWQPDPTMDIDKRATKQAGVEGLKKRTIRITYENGREIKRSIDREWIDAAPVTQIINYGTKITKRELTLPDGSTITYWRKIRVLATSYTAATSGKARSHPEYGITATGMRATVGVVAVDPRVINLRTRLYVPGYGLSIAGDTGGKIKGKRIDLGYDEWNLVLWYKWVDVYLIDPPPADQIHWIIPDTPKERSTR
jgi:uncharacterized protein YabE (DUF348 family)